MEEKKEKRKISKSLWIVIAIVVIGALIILFTSENSGKGQSVTPANFDSLNGYWNSGSIYLYIDDTKYALYLGGEYNRTLSGRVEYENGKIDFVTGGNSQLAYTNVKIDGDDFYGKSGGKTYIYKRIDEATFAEYAGDSGPQIIAQRNTNFQNSDTTKEETSVADNTETEAASETSTSETPTTTRTTYPSGMYKVGVDMPAGDYIAQATNGSGYIEITSDSSGSFESIIGNENFGTITYFRVYDGEYVKLSRAQAIPVDTVYTPNVLKNGTFLVGKDLPAGEYQITANGHGYWERDSTPVGSDNSMFTIIANDNFEDGTYVTVYDGEYLTLSGDATITK